MRQVLATQFGGPEVLATTTTSDPVAGPGQVVVDAAVVDTLFVDTQIRRGWVREHFSVQPPYVPGGGVAGVVSSVGDGVDPDWIGRRVVAHTGERGGHGGYAERTVVAADAIVVVPDGLDLQTATAVLHDGATALGLVDNARIRPREWVLVLAAGGGLGILLVQLVHAAGGRVIAAARGRHKLGIVRTLGADVVVDYSEPDWAERVREATGGTGPDVVFDGAGGELGRAAFEITARGGRFSAHGGPSGGFTVIDPYEAERRRVTVRGIEQVQYSPAELQSMTERALSEAAEGRIKPVIGRTFPLEQAADAHAAIEARDVVGKTLLLTNGQEPNSSAFTVAERAYLRTQHLGRLATIGPSGAPQVNPVAYWVNDGAEAIDIGGPALRESQKFRNIQADPRVSFVVDDIATPEESLGPGGQRGRGLEIRGRAETFVVEQPLMDGFSNDVIRIHPRRVVAWNLDGPGPNIRDVS
ncbi:MAG TPA: PPOX class F420-dependent oxidoreductase [Acidimicrobiia bacterium]|nr:PPOX class F420-dependent oxidoreductase [Acidimicrobiia bacterium]